MHYYRVTYRSTKIRSPRVFGTRAAVVTWNRMEKTRMHMRLFVRPSVSKIRLFRFISHDQIR